MANNYTMFDYIVDIFKGDAPGPIAMRKVPDDTGAAGEYLIKYILDEWPKTAGYPIYTNLIVPNNESKVGTAEIDVLMISRAGIYVFESKNYTGWVFGSTDERQWTVSLSSNRKERFYNPIMQNRTHIKALSAYLDLPDSAFRSYIVFSRRCDLKKVPDSNDEFTICQRPALRKNLRRDFKKHRDELSWDEVRFFKAKLDALVKTSTTEAREEHVEQIKNVQTTCPWCGKQLVERHRKSDGGMFIGCSGYPECRYLRNQW